MQPEITPMAGTSKGKRTRGLFARLNHQYDSFMPGCNWRDFTLVSIGGEWSSMSGSVELNLALLGVHLNLTYVYDDGFRKMLMEQRDEMLSRSVTEDK